jgi:hypothetical protein
MRPVSLDRERPDSRPHTDRWHAKSAIRRCSPSEAVTVSDPGSTSMARASPPIWSAIRATKMAIVAATERPFCCAQHPNTYRRITRAATIAMVHMMTSSEWYESRGHRRLDRDCRRTADQVCLRIPLPGSGVGGRLHLHRLQDPDRALERYGLDAAAQPNPGPSQPAIRRGRHLHPQRLGSRSPRERVDPATLERHHLEITRCQRLVLYGW